LSRHGATLADQTTQRLRASILQLQLRPGERLVERDVAEREGVSRTCVRAALQALEREGLVRRDDGRGLLVATLSAEQARQIYELREAIEPAMARLFVVRASAEERTALLSASAAAQDAAKRDDQSAFVRAHTEFFDVLLRGSGNAVAREMLATLHARITYLRIVTTEGSYRARRMRTAALLERIALAAQRGDAAGTARGCASFVRRSLQFALQVLRTG
jgi:DNA-binding GntR family transcriptional regulator